MNYSCHDEVIQMLLWVQAKIKAQKKVFIFQFKPFVLT